MAFLQPKMAIDWLASQSSRTISRLKVVILWVSGLLNWHHFCRDFIQVSIALYKIPRLKDLKHTFKTRNIFQLYFNSRPKMALIRGQVCLRFTFEFTAENGIDWVTSLSLIRLRFTNFTDENGTDWVASLSLIHGRIWVELRLWCQNGSRFLVSKWVQFWW